MVDPSTANEKAVRGPLTFGFSGSLLRFSGEGYRVTSMNSKASLTDLVTPRLDHLPTCILNRFDDRLTLSSNPDIPQNVYRELRMLA